jgi:hypothetical protein
MIHWLWNAAMAPELLEHQFGQPSMQANLAASIQHKFYVTVQMKLQRNLRMKPQLTIRSN